MVLIAQSRKLEMHDVPSHSLRPLPWAFANGDGTMKKTKKAILSKHLERKVLQTEDTPHMLGVGLMVRVLGLGS